VTNKHGPSGKTSAICTADPSPDISFGPGLKVKGCMACDP
jgi:hypothetical protein